MRINDVRARGKCDQCHSFTEVARYGIQTDLCDECAIDLYDQVVYAVDCRGETPSCDNPGER